jgi:molybdopterin-guanine dinucleotide biosynthesis protein A
MNDHRRSAAILAGGLATRLGGRDKSALLVDGRTILDRQIDVLAPLVDDLMIVGHGATVAQGFQPSDRSPALRQAHGAPSSPRGETAAPHLIPGARVIADIVPGCGPLGGLHAALTAARSDVLFLVACDMPYVSSALVEHLLSLAGDADAVVPQTERGYHPLCAVYTRACLEPAAAQLADRRLKMLELLHRVRLRAVPIEEIRRFGAPDRLLANVNTPADYAGLETLQGHKL